MMKSSSKQITTTWAVASVGGAAVACYALYRRTKSKQAQAKAISKPVNKNNVSAVSHIHLQVEDVTKSKEFYLSFGFIVESQHASMVLMKSPGDASGSKKQPYLLLEENKQRTRRVGHAAAVGYARMCFLVENCAQESSRLAKLGYQPIAPIVTDRPGNPIENNPPVSVVAYSDPDGNMLELVNFTTGNAALTLKMLRIMGVVKFPIWIHVNINATSYDQSHKAYQLLGFTEMNKDYGKVENTLYQSLAIPSPGIAKQVSLIKIPEASHFLIDLIEWEEPKTEQPVCVGDTIRLAVTVDDVAMKLDELVVLGDGLWSLESGPACVHLPPPLKRAVRCTVKDPDGVSVDLVSYPESILLNKNHSLICAEKEKYILITGCDSGFGRSLAIQMTGLGFKVIAACYTTEGAKFLNSIATTVVGDLTTEKGLKDVVNAVRSKVNFEKGTQLWAIVNNAGMHMPGHVEWIDPEAYKRVMALNFHAPVYLIHEFTPLLRKSKGRVVNVTSVCGIVAAPSNSAYSASKFALEALSDSLRVENKAFGVDVVVVQPTTMRTPLAFNWYKAWADNYENADPKKRSMHSAAWASGLVQTGSDMLEAVAEDPRITVGEMVNALVMENPPPRILSGVGAVGYHQLSRAPDSVRDQIFHIGPDPDESDKGFESEYLKSGTKAAETK